MGNKFGIFFSVLSRARWINFFSPTHHTHIDAHDRIIIAKRGVKWAKKDPKYYVKYKNFTSCLEAQKPLWQNYVDTCRNTKNVEESATSLESITNVRNKILQELSCEPKVGKAWECRKAESSDLYVPRWP